MGSPVLVVTTTAPALLCDTEKYTHLKSKLSEFSDPQAFECGSGATVFIDMDKLESEKDWNILSDFINLGPDTLDVYGNGNVSCVMALVDRGFLKLFDHLSDCKDQFKDEEYFERVRCEDGPFIGLNL